MFLRNEFLIIVLVVVRHTSGKPDPPYTQSRWK